MSIIDTQRKTENHANSVSMLIFKFLASIIVSSSIYGCGGPLIAYSLPPYEIPKQSKYYAKTIRIDTVYDFRRLNSHYPDEIFSTDFAATEYDCYNRDAKYSKPETITQIKNAFESHLMIKQIFRSVINSNKQTDLQLHFEVHDFSTHAEVNRSAREVEKTALQFGAIGGVIGAIANSNKTSPYEYNIVYKNIEITDSNKRRILLIPYFKSQTTKIDTAALTDCLQAFTMLNLKLKDHNEMLLRAISDSLAGIK